MKKRLISVLLLIVMFTSFSFYALAETVLLDRSQPSFDEETAYKANDYVGSYGVRGTSNQGNGIITLSEKDGNKMMKMAITNSVTSGYNYAMMTMFVNRNLKEYFKKGMIISYDLIAPENGKIVFHAYGANYSPRHLYSVDNGVLIPGEAGKAITDTNKHATLEKGKMHNIKLALHASTKSYTIFLDGIQVGDTYTLADNYFQSTDKGEIPRFYLSLRIMH